MYMYINVLGAKVHTAVITLSVILSQFNISAFPYTCTCDDSQR